MNAAEWNAALRSLPNGHVLQTWEWGQVKKDIYGWEMIPRLWKDETGQVEAAAMVLLRKAPLPIVGDLVKVLYVPRGPILDWSDQALRKKVLNDLQKLARDKGALFIKIDPELQLGTGVPGTENEQPNAVGEKTLDEMKTRRWVYSNSQIQFKNSVFLDLTTPEEEQLAGFKQKTRYNIRLAGRKGVAIREGGLDDLELLYEMYLETSVRDGFVIRSKEYYLYLWEKFIRGKMAKVLMAEVDGEPVSGLILFHFAGRSWFIFGMSTQKHRKLMPNYLIQWETLRVSRELGCHSYDMWGAPNVFDESDSMWGVFRFKEGFQGTVIRTCGAWDYAPNKLLYSAYVHILPKLLGLMRSRGKQKAQRQIGT